MQTLYFNVRFSFLFNLHVNLHLTIWKQSCKMRISRDQRGQAIKMLTIPVETKKYQEKKKAFSIPQMMKHDKCKFC